jgi:uncharacterized membrane protein
MALVGRLHPLLVHFPIALILAAAAAELVFILSDGGKWRTIALANLRAGAATSVLTAVTGWRLAASGFAEPSALLAWHRWIGLGAVVTAVAAGLSGGEGVSRVRRATVVYRAALFASAALIAAAGHAGGMLVWGPDLLGR